MSTTKTRKSKAERIPFTKARLQAVTVPDGKDRVYVYDEVVRGLAFCLTAAGTANYYAYGRSKGKPKRDRLGSFTSMTVDKAREAARESLLAMHRGIDPVEQRRQERQQAETEKAERVTFADLFAHYLEHHAKPHKRTWREDEAKFNRDLKPLHNRPIHDITRAEIVKLHTDIGKRAKGQANRVLALISKVLNHGKEHFKLGENVATGIKKYQDQQRERPLAPEELPRFFKALDEHPSPMFADFFRLCLFTGQRCGNIQRMRFEQIDETRGIWMIPGEEFKNGRAQSVNLTAEAMAVIERRRAATSGTGYVFPSTRSSDTGHVKHPYTAWQTLLDLAGIRDLRIHDLRHTMGSWLASTGAGGRVVGGALGHRSAAARQRYEHLLTGGGMNPVRDAFNKATAAMMAASKADNAEQQTDEQSSE
ncbi:tyrosine-type recombinase/integrase [Phycisphaerales bacterium AB-hyl4]|uniref:Tyrosine-type recombinase/integrase n=1 Tax=Natronomicrosphaera hydrolytica TaxID=3242702 RepID=A0ABV4U4N6_9BACT